MWLRVIVTRASELCCCLSLSACVVWRHLGVGFVLLRPSDSHLLLRHDDVIRTLCADWSAKPPDHTPGHASSYVQEAAIGCFCASCSDLCWLQCPRLLRWRYTQCTSGSTAYFRRAVLKNHLNTEKCSIIKISAL